MATYRRTVLTTSVTSEMLKAFSEEFGDCYWDEYGPSFRKYGRQVNVDPDTGLWTFDRDDIEMCRKALKAEPESEISIHVLKPRDDVSFALTDEIRRAMIDRWGGLFFEDIFGVYE